MGDEWDEPGLVPRTPGVASTDPLTFVVGASVPAVGDEGSDALQLLELLLGDGGTDATGDDAAASSRASSASSTDTLSESECTLSEQASSSSSDSEETVYIWKTCLRMTLRSAALFVCS